ncbi:hypothetical protein [Defluviitalea phaphyphila]|uniref:hypothetical protein n=1 Tax=Defluviitalea phaphyphila TaxID=1473580 RepID=UPI00136537D4|nr:hypothetical protein [Defluviitalea phaphyphila]
MRDNDEISMEKAWEYMITMGEEFKSNHILYMPIPQKISRCLNLGSILMLK